MTSVDDAERLRVIAERADKGRPLGEDGAWLARRLRRYLEHAPSGLTLDQALGVAFDGRGERWWRTAARRRRDAELRALAGAHFGHMQPFEQAVTIARLGRRYAAAGWRRDRGLDQPPASAIGTPTEFLWRAMMAAEIPGSERQVYAILRRSPEKVSQGPISAAG